MDERRRRPQARGQRPGQHPGQRRERPLTPGGLERSAAWHLTRKAMTEAELRTALEKKARRAAAEHGPNPDAAGWIDALLVRLKDSLLIDDARVAHARVESARARGLSRRRLTQKLRQQGLDADLITETIADVDARAGQRFSLGPIGAIDDVEPVDAELQAALRYAGRRRLEKKDPQKALAAIARQGFSFDIARKALAALLLANAQDDDTDAAEVAPDDDDA